MKLGDSRIDVPRVLWLHWKLVRRRRVSSTLNRTPHVTQHSMVHTATLIWLLEKREVIAQQLPKVPASQPGWHRDQSGDPGAIHQVSVIQPH